MINSFISACDRIPSELSYFSGSITKLNLAENSLSGTIPISLGDLSKLVELNLSSNALSGPIPESFRNLEMIGEFGIHYLHKYFLSLLFLITLIFLARQLTFVPEQKFDRFFSGNVPCKHDH